LAWPAARRPWAGNLRDRAYTYLDDLMSELREAGRYAFRKDRALVRRFSSRYLRRRRRSTAEAG
jgi:hypothetical protein